MIVKDETGKRYGPYIVIKRATLNYPISGAAKWECRCVHCGARKIYIGNALRFGHHARTCKECKRR